MTQSPKQSNPAVDELRAIRQELREIREDLHKVKEQGKRPLNLVDQIAKGVMLAGIGWIIIYFVLQIIIGSLF